MDTLLLLQLTLSFATGRSLSPPALATAVAEADNLWSRYGVRIMAADDCSAPIASPVVRVTVAHARRVPAGRRLPAAPRRSESQPLGAITFSEDGTPSPVISLFLADIFQLVAGARVLGALESQWPPEMRERIVGRVIGRVLAHEIGHYLLRTRDHGRDGLMRPNHLAFMLVAPERRPFALSKPEAARFARQPQARAEDAR
jgi:hypothetical protein